MNHFMVDWSGGNIAPEHMLVMRTVASQMLTGIIDAVTVDFTHDLCGGRLTNKGKTIFGNQGGTLFFGDLGQLNGQPHTVTFFVPKGYENHRFRADSLITRQRYDENNRPVGYPEDVDVAAVKRGRIKLSNKKS